MASCIPPSSGVVQSISPSRDLVPWLILASCGVDGPLVQPLPLSPWTELKKDRGAQGDWLEGFPPVFFLFKVSSERLINRWDGWRDRQLVMQCWRLHTHHHMHIGLSVLCMDVHIDSRDRHL